MSSTTLTRARLAAPQAAPKRPRDPWFDNAKMLLVLLVVVGHSWTLVADTTFNDRLYDWLYLWHIPAFVMVTGYLSRRFSYTRANLRRLVTTVVLPYLVFEGLLAIFRVKVGGETLERLWLNPHWPMWYLSALFFWRLGTPLLRRLPHPLLTALGISLVGGVLAVETFDINRVMGLLPFFALGLLAEKRHLDALRSPGARMAGLAVLVGGAWLTPWVEDTIGTEWLYYRTPYAALHVTWLQGAGIRLVLIAAGTAMALAALAWVPQRGGRLARMGAASLVVYLFHGFVVKGAEYAGFEGWAAGHPVLSLAVATVAAASLALFLAWRPVAKPLEKVVTPAP
jgi:fucose 4-O-acetylase-like acetyltransferase